MAGANSPNRLINQHFSESQIDMAFEDGMQIIFDMITGTATVEFRGTVEMLGPFRTQKEANEAGETYCRESSWAEARVTGASKLR